MSTTEPGPLEEQQLHSGPLSSGQQLHSGSLSSGQQLHSDSAECVSSVIPTKRRTSRTLSDIDSVPQKLLRSSRTTRRSTGHSERSEKSSRVFYGGLGFDSEEDANRFKVQLEKELDRRRRRPFPMFVKRKKSSMSEELLDELEDFLMEYGGDKLNISVPEEQNIAATEEVIRDCLALKRSPNGDDLLGKYIWRTLGKDSTKALFFSKGRKLSELVSKVAPNQLVSESTLTEAKKRIVASQNSA